MAPAKHGVGVPRPNPRRDGRGNTPLLVYIFAGLLGIFAFTNIWALLKGQPASGFAMKCLGFFSILLPAGHVAAQAGHSELPYYGRSPPVYPSRMLQ